MAGGPHGPHNFLLGERQVCDELRDGHQGGVGRCQGGTKGVAESAGGSIFPDCLLTVHQYTLKAHVKEESKVSQLVLGGPSSTHCLLIVHMYALAAYK